ncbi:MAG: hypothetical protein RBS06_11900 [Arenimonas caeni]|jgi:hypothetical protein|nr:hypothetical protein [Arenimonas caeni]
MFLLLLAPLIANARNFTPVAGDGQRLEYENGQPVLFIDRPDFAAAITFEPESRKRGWINLGVINRSEATFLVSERSVSARQGTTELRTLTYEDLLKQQKRREMWANIGAGLAASANSYSASQAGHTSYSGTYYGSSSATAYSGGRTAYASGTSSGVYSGSYYDAGAAAQAQAVADQKNRELIAQTQAASADQRASLDARALRANTLDPGESVMGGVMVVLPKKKRGGTEFTVSIRIGDNEEQVRFTESAN